MLSVKEWNVDFLLQRFLWNPFKWVGKQLHFIKGKFYIIFFGLIFMLGLYAFVYGETTPSNILEVLPLLFSLAALLLVLKAFTEREDAKRAWLLVFASQFFIALSVSLNDQFEMSEVLIFLSGSFVSYIAGYICLSILQSRREAIDMNRFHGYLYEQPTLAFVFLISCLGMLGFPITPTFIGFDLLFSHIRTDQYALIIFTALSFVFIELSVLRIYARLFLGQHKKAYHPIAYRSS